MKKKIRLLIFGIWGKDAAYSRLRFAGPLGYLPEDEFDVTYVSSVKAILKLPSVPDVIVAGRAPFPSGAGENIMRFARMMKIPVVVDIDDLLTDLPQQHRERRRNEDMKSALVKHLREADVVAVTTDALKNTLKAYNPNVHVLPNLIDENVWTCTGTRRRSKIEEVVIGFGGTITHDYDFACAVPAIRHVLAKYPGRVRIKLIGCAPAELAGIAGVEHIAPIRSYRKYARTLYESGFDLMVAPLEDNQFNRCKSNIKFLEYSICGYPGIYSAVGPYPGSVRNRETGILVRNTTEEWIAALELLINDRELRSRIGRSAQDHVKSAYLMKNGAEAWRSFYKGLGGRGTAGRQRFSFEPVRAYGGYVIYDARCKWTSWIERRFFKTAAL